MDADARLVKLLTEIGFMAGGHGLRAEAERIFEGLRAVRPDSEVPFIGLALMQMNAGRNEEAVRVLWEQALRANPASAHAKCFLGLALRLTGRMSESERILREVAGSEDADGGARALADALLARRPEVGGMER